MNIKLGRNLKNYDKKEMTNFGCLGNSDSFL